MEGEAGPGGLLPPGSQVKGSGSCKAPHGAADLENSSGQARSAPASPSEDVPKGVHRFSLISFRVNVVFTNQEGSLKFPTSNNCFLKDMPSA